MDFQKVLDSVEEVPGGLYAVAGAVVAGLVGVVFVLCCAVKRGTRGKEAVVKERLGSVSESEGEESSRPKNKGSKLKQSSNKKVTLPTHPLLATEFKGHTGAVLSLNFDENGKYLASCSTDRTIRLWHIKTLEDKEHKYTRKNLDLDHATHVKLSPDGTAVIATLAVGNTIRVYRITKAQKGGVASLSNTDVEFPKLSSSTILSMDIARSGKFIMTFDLDNFTVWTLKGEQLTSVQTLQNPNTCAAISPCSKFVACAGFTTGVKLWEVEFSKNGEYQKVSKAMDLTGHHASVLSLSFSTDSRRMATASKDGTWKYWDIDVEYKLREDPKLLSTGRIPSQGGTCVSLSPDSRVVAVAVDTSIFMYSSTSADLLQTLDNVHRDVVSALCWDPHSLYLVSAGGEDRHIRVWHNTCGMRELIADLEGKLPKASSAPLKRRIEGQLKETRARLQSIES